MLKGKGLSTVRGGGWVLTREGIVNSQGGGWVLTVFVLSGGTLQVISVAAVSPKSVSKGVVVSEDRGAAAPRSPKGQELVHIVCRLVIVELGSRRVPYCRRCCRVFARGTGCS
jgi:hypothetical protein